jgi:hypothetical protein
MNNFEATVLKGIAAHSLPYRNGHYVVRPNSVSCRTRSLRSTVTARNRRRSFASLGDSPSGRLIRYGRSSHPLTAHCFQNNSASQELH